MKFNIHDKKTQYMIAGGVALVVIFLYLRSRSSSSAAAANPADTTGTTDAASTDPGYADLAGQQQGDEAQEASDVSGLSSQEGADVSNLQGQITAAGGQEASDIAGLGQEIDNIPAGATGAAGAPGVAPGTIAKLTKRITALQKKVAAEQAGQKRPDKQPVGKPGKPHPQKPSTVHTHGKSNTRKNGGSVAARSHDKPTHKPPAPKPPAKPAQHQPNPPKPAPKPAPKPKAKAKH